MAGRVKIGLGKYNPFKFIDDRIQVWVIRDVCYLVGFIFLFVLASILPDVAGTRIIFLLVFGLLAVVYYLKIYDDIFIILGTPALRYDADELVIVLWLAFCLVFGFGLLTLLVIIAFMTSSQKYKKYVQERQQLYEKQVSDLFDTLSNGDIPGSLALIDEMGRLNNYLAIEPLAILMEDHDEAVRTHAGQALTLLNSKAAKRKMGRPANVPLVASAQSDKR